METADVHEARRQPLAPPLVEWAQEQSLRETQRAHALCCNRFLLGTCADHRTHTPTKIISNHAPSSDTLELPLSKT